MHSLLSYQQDEPAYDKNAHTVTSIYHGGTLKMYTSHTSPPRTSRTRLEYYTTQINTWGMTGNVETFRQGAAAYRNARDWAKERRDNAIGHANERAIPVDTEPPNDAACASPTLSFVTVSETEVHTTSQQSRTSLETVFNIKDGDEESDSSVEDTEAVVLPAKRSSKSSKLMQTQRKRQNADATRDKTLPSGV